MSFSPFENFATKLNNAQALRQMQQYLTTNSIAVVWPNWVLQLMYLTTLNITIFSNYCAYNTEYWKPALKIYTCARNFFDVREGLIIANTSRCEPDVINRQVWVWLGCMWTLVIVNQFFGSKSWNKVVAEKSWLTVYMTL